MSPLGDLLQRFLQDRYGAEVRRRIVESEPGWSAEIWSEFAELGVLGAFVSETCGGLGASPDELVSLMEALGRSLVVEPFASTGVIGGTLFSELNDSDAITAILGGRMRLALAHDEQPFGLNGAGTATTAVPVEEGYRISGRKIVVRDAPSATDLIVSAAMPGSGDFCLFRVSPATKGVSLNSYRLIDGIPAADVHLNDATVAPSALLCSGDSARALLVDVIAAATISVCAEATGVMRAMLEQTTSYLCDRTQFGKPLASFQALQHRLADMLIEVEQASSLTLRAATARHDPVAVSAAKMRVNEALRAVSHGAVQLHGGIGTTAEIPLSQYFRRAAAMERQFGSTSEHRHRFEQHLLRDLEGDTVDGPAVAKNRCRARRIEEPEEEFREEVAEFLRTQFTPELREAADRQAGMFAEPSLAQAWHRILYRRGWIAPAWPRDHGGSGWTPSQRLLFENACALANTPVLPTMGLQMCGPVLIEYGTASQKEFFLPRILSGEHCWCQGYSEPNAGSDLASIRTRAIRKDDHYLVTGTKIWTTYAHVANWMFLLARTNPEGKPQRGITFLLVPMDSSGISVAPILSMSGEHEVNQVFLDEVRVPVELRVGEENEGWTVAKYLLEFERGGGSATARTLRVAGLIRRLVRDLGSRERDLVHRLASLQVELLATEWTQRRVLAATKPGDSIGATNSSLLKLKASELYQQASMILHDAAGTWGAIDQAHALGNGGRAHGPALALTAAARYMNSRSMSIFGGSSEIQRSILARQVLGL